MVATKSYHVERAWTTLEYLYRVQTQIQTIGWGVVVATKSYHVERAWTTLEYLYRVQTQTIGFFFGGRVVVATKSYHVERAWTILEYLYSWLQPSPAHTCTLHATS